MRSRPLPLLPFDAIGAEQLEWDGATEDITAETAVGQSFRCAEDGLHRIEVFVEPTFHFTRCHLWLFVFEDRPRDRMRARVPLRLAGPLASEKLTAHGWFSFEFEPIANSALRRFRFELQSPDGAPGNALRVRALKTNTADPRVAFRASCLIAPELLPNFQRYRDYAQHRSLELTHQPLLARLEISRPCNLHCIMCQRGLHPFDPRRESPGFMSLATVQALDPILPTLLRVVALGLGEPFLNPQLLEILRHIRTHNAHAHIFTSTNGTRLMDETIAALLDENLVSELQISLDGIERETFEQIRRNASFDVVFGAFARVAAARARRRNASLSLTAAMLVMKPTRDHVLRFVQHMADLGVDRISLDSPKDVAFQPLRADRDDDMARISEQVSRAEEWLADTDTELNGPLLAELIVWHRRRGHDNVPRWGVDECARLAPATTTRPSACSVPWESFTLAADGAVNVCCNSIRRMGDVRTDGIERVWQRGAGYAALRQELVTRTLHADCSRCIGENFVVPGETTPAIYLDGCLRPGPAARSAAWLGRAVPSESVRRASELCVEIHQNTGPSSKLSGLLIAASETDFRTNHDEPLLIGVETDGILQAITVAAPIDGAAAHWSAQFPGGGEIFAPGRLNVFVITNDGWREPLLRAEPRVEPPGSTNEQLHGFVDEVRRMGNRIHVRGWVRDARTGRPAHRVIARLGGQVVSGGQPWLPRADVRGVFGGTSVNFGYSLDVPLGLVGDPAADALALLAVDAQGAAAPLEWSEPARAAWSRLLTPRPLARLRRLALRIIPAAEAARASPDPACSAPATAWS